MTTRKMILVVAALAAISLFAASAQAGGYGHYYGYGRYSADFTRLYSDQIHAPPYFSMHPPVYYSRPVARTYGYSPYAYPPEMITPDYAPRVGPVVLNPYVTREASSPRVAAVLSRVENPYAASATETAAEVVAEK